MSEIKLVSFKHSEQLANFCADLLYGFRDTLEGTYPLNETAYKTNLEYLKKQVHFVDERNAPFVGYNEVESYEFIGYAHATPDLFRIAMFLSLQDLYEQRGIFTQYDDAPVVLLYQPTRKEIIACHMDFVVFSVYKQYEKHFLENVHILRRCSHMP